jgi:hypothetical protein
LEESLALRRELGDTAGVTYTLFNLAETACRQGDYQRARGLSVEGLALCRAVGNKAFSAQMLGQLGEVARSEGDYQRAEMLYGEGLTELQEFLKSPDHEVMVVNMGIVGPADLLEGMAQAAGAQGQPERGARLFGAAAGLRQARVLCFRSDYRRQAEYEPTIADLRTALGEEAFAAAWAEGRALPLEQAIALALGTDVAGG